MSFEMERQISAQSKEEKIEKSTKYFDSSNLPKPVAAASAAPLSGHTNSVSRVVAVDGGSLIATACYDGKVRVYDSAGGACIPKHELSGHSGLVLGLAHLNGSIIVSGGWDDRIFTWDARSGKRLSTVSIPDASLNSIAAIGDNSFVAGTGGGDLVFFTHKAGRQVQEQKRIASAHSTWINHVCVNGDFLVTASFDKTAALWSISEKKKLAVLTHPSNVWCAALSTRYLATGAQGEVRVYEIHNNCELRLVLKGVHADEFVHAVNLAGDEWLLSAGGDGTVAFTSLITETPAVRVATAVPYVLDITLLPNGRVAVCGNESNDSYSSIFDSPETVEEPLKEYSRTLFPAKNVSSIPSSRTTENKEIEEKVSLETESVSKEDSIVIPDKKMEKSVSLDTCAYKSDEKLNNSQEQETKGKTMSRNKENADEIPAEKEEVASTVPAREEIKQSELLKDSGNEEEDGESYVGMMVRQWSNFDPAETVSRKMKAKPQMHPRVRSMPAVHATPPVRANDDSIGKTTSKEDSPTTKSVKSMVEQWTKRANNR